MKERKREGVKQRKREGVKERKSERQKDQSFTFERWPKCTLVNEIQLVLISILVNK